jgi:hypothetical protein
MMWLLPVVPLIVGVLPKQVGPVVACAPGRFNASNPTPATNNACFFMWPPTKVNP